MPGQRPSQPAWAAPDGTPGWVTAAEDARWQTMDAALRVLADRILDSGWQVAAVELYAPLESVCDRDLNVEFARLAARFGVSSLELEADLNERQRHQVAKRLATEPDPALTRERVRGLLAETAPRLLAEALLASALQQGKLIEMAAYATAGTGIDVDAGNPGSLHHGAMLLKAERFAPICRAHLDGTGTQHAARHVRA